MSKMGARLRKKNGLCKFFVIFFVFLPPFGICCIGNRRLRESF
jgi:hypothetical protein